MSDYTTTVGIEVHAELHTKSKMFCGCPNDPHAAAPNTNVCPVCMAHPGTLPVVNKEAVRLMMVVGRAIGGTLADYSEFDRKNYFYPDIPKAYQISQYAFPFVSGGELGGVAITRIHLEEDTARSQHATDHSLVDFNRAGVPLMELVTEPVIHSAEQGGAFVRELQLLLRTLGASEANMERGEMRVEANISVSTTDTFGTKVEVKNLNSFKAMESAIEYETKRQIELLESGGTVVQETRGWDDQKSKTFSQRVKESADDYRYFPDPDIPKFQRSQNAELRDEAIDKMMPETPDQKRHRLREQGIADDQIEIIVSQLGREAFFSAALASVQEDGAVKILANYFTSDVLGLVEAEGLSLSEAHPVMFALLADIVAKGDVNSRVAKDLLTEVVCEGADPEQLAKDRGLLQQSSADDLAPVVEAVLEEHPAVVEEYKAGKEASLQFLIGQGMKATKGAANPGVLATLFKERLSK